MTAEALERRPPAVGSPLGAVRFRRGLVALLVVAAGFAWWWTTRRMSGMDEGPWTTLGAFVSFLSLWVVMMAAMMFPSVAPTVALYARMTRSRSPVAGIVFAVGYLVTWTAAGLGAYALSYAGGRWAHGLVAWDRGGRWITALTLLAAAGYQLTPLKDVCLGKCRSPLGALLGSWRGGLRGALSMGARNGAWCVGCCWALMASLFALGIMSVVWMAFVAALVAAEKLLRRQRVATFGAAAVLLAFAVVMALAPHALPGLTIPAGSAPGMGMDPR